MKKSNHTFQVIKAYFPPLFWAGLIFILSDQSTLPGANSPLLDYVFKQGAHVFVYAVLHFLIWRGVKLTHPTKAKLIYLPILLSLAYAISDEWHQSLVPGRAPTLQDIGFDSLGIFSSHYLTHRQKTIHSDTLR